MSQLIYNFNSYEFWELYAPSEGTYGNQRVTFDGVNRIIRINFGETCIDFQEDIYSNWKEWVLVGNNARYAEAMRVTGGERTTSTTRVGITYFLINGWRIKPFEGDHELKITGNFYTEEIDQNPFVPPEGNFQVVINRMSSESTTIVEVEVPADIDLIKLDELHRLHGLDPNAPLQVSELLRTAGPDIIQDITPEDDPVVVTRRPPNTNP